VEVGARGVPRGAKAGLVKAIFLLPEASAQGFEDMMGLRAREMSAALSRLGVEVQELDMGELQSIGTNELRARVVGFRPDFVTAPNFNYYLLAGLRKGLHELFEDTGIRVVALWDDPLGALANFLQRQTMLEQASPPPPSPPPTRVGSLFERVQRRLGQQSPPPPAPVQRDALMFFRRLASSPHVVHFAWDSGHQESIAALGIAPAERIHWYALPTFRAFLEQGRRSGVEEIRDVAFCGNLYPDTLERSPFFADPELRAIVEEVCAAKLAALDRASFDLLQQALARRSPEQRARLGLDPRRQRFWDFYLFVVWQAVNTRVRLAILTGVKHPIDVFGMFADPASIEKLGAYGNLHYAGNAPHFDGLPGVYASTRVNVCVGNALIHRGLPSKLIDCLAAGGFALSDPKQDLVRVFGEDVRRIFFHDAADLEAGIDHFLSHPKERREIVDGMLPVLREKCTLEATFRTVLSVLERKGA
jgi:hypothetical protein